MRTIDLRSAPELEIPRPEMGDEPLQRVREIIERVRREGDDALLFFSEKLEGVRLAASDLRVAAEELDKAAASVPTDLIEAMQISAGRLRQFCERQLHKTWDDLNIGGGRLGEMVHPVARAGAYSPGGRAIYPSVVLMSAVPADVAGVPRRILCVPPGPGGAVPPATLAAAHLAGVDEIYRIGGAQAIAAMAFGTESVPQVDVITGGGGLFVALAKRELAGFVGIDSVAGPSEIAVLADASADPVVVACDLIAQAEHGPNGAFVVITWDEDLGLRVVSALAERLDAIGAHAELRKTLAEGAVCALVSNRDQAVEAVSRFAPEHAELIFEGAEHAVGAIRNCGAIFVGPYSPVSLGDYAAGSNHTLPTMGAARWASGLRASIFQRLTTVVRHDRDSMAASAPLVRAFAAAEELPHHAAAVDCRLEER